MTDNRLSLSTVTTSIPREHVLFVHAHPDDESITTGGTIATLLDSGAAVTLVTCTRGELGEVVPAELQHLSGDALGEHRESELAAAMAVLGLDDYRFLGSEKACAVGAAPHRFRDSGMQWGPTGPEPLAATRYDASNPLSFSLTEASLEALVADISSVIADVQPTAVVSYDSGGGYGHPDHVRTHDAAGIAAVMMELPFYTIVPAGPATDGDIRVDVSHVMERKKQALRAYRTQLMVHGDSIVHSGGQVEPIASVEVFRRDGTEKGSELDWSSLSGPSKIVTCVLAFLVGAVIGAIGTANHQIAFGAISLLVSAGALVGLRLLFGIRTVAGCAALGVLLMATLLSTESSGGSHLIPVSFAGVAWNYALPVMALLVLAWPSVGRRAGDTMEKVTDPKKVVDAS